MKRIWIAVVMICLHLTVMAQSGKNNPVFEGWYADPEAILIGNEYWIFPTYSAKYN
jgi:hypothetical protein